MSNRSRNADLMRAHNTIFAPGVALAPLVLAFLSVATASLVASADTWAQSDRVEQANAGAPGPARGRAPKGAQGIAVLVNDEPITGYEIEQRAAFLALQNAPNASSMKAKAEARWKSIVKDPNTNKRFQEYLRKNNVQSQEQARALQEKFIKQLQQNMMNQIRSEARSTALSGARDKAQEELIEETLKLQEAKKQNAVAEDADVDKIISGIAERNNMTMEQFAQHMKGMGVDIATMKARFRAEISWREVVRRRFGHMVAITDRDVDRLVANAASADADMELQVQRITLPITSAVDQSVIAKRIAEADLLATRFTGCDSMPTLAAAATGAKFENLGSVKPSSIPEPTRTLLLNATEGDLLPSSIGSSGIELWALCGRKAGDAATRETAQNELRQEEFNVLAQRHLKDLRQDAAIEIR